MKSRMVLVFAAMGFCCLLSTDMARAQGGAAATRQGFMMPGKGVPGSHSGGPLPLLMLGREVGPAGRLQPARPAAIRAAQRAAWADRVMGGPPGSLDARLELSAAHALVREFSVDSAFATSDAALARVLTDDRSLTSASLTATLDRYAAQLTDVAAAPARPNALGPVQVRRVGQIAVIRPGTGSFSLPPQTEIVVVDLRDLPADDNLTEILPRMVAPALKQPVTQPARRVRIHEGPADEVFIPTSVYSTSVITRTSEPLPATGDRDLPILLHVGRRIAPQAAAFAASLRAARRAWVVGDSVPVAVAESTWHGVASHGLAVRTSLLESGVEMPPGPLTNQVATQDDPNDPTTATYRNEFSLVGGSNGVAEVSIDGPDGADLDLYVMYDANGDGNFDLGTELVGISASSTADELVRVDPAPAGRYQALVHGWFVPGGTATFTLHRKLIAPLPDELRADLSADQAAPDYPRLAEQVAGRVPPAVSGAATRGAPLVINPFGYRHPVASGRGELRADLLIAHGVVRMFFQYFPVVGDSIDGRLLETLRAADAYDGDDRIAFWRILRRFGEALHDGHQFVSSVEPFHTSILPVWLEHIDGRPVVRRSAAAAIHPGDTIVALNGRAIEEVYAEELARTSAATLGYKLDIADRYIYRTNGSMTLLLEDPAGARRTVSVTPVGTADYTDVRNHGVSDRPSGPLTALGAPSLYYLNLNTFSMPSPASMRAAIREAASLGSTGMVLDMRGYPGGADHYETAARLIRQQFLSPIFGVPLYSGPNELDVLPVQFPIEPLATGFSGPIVMLTGPHAVSAAENFMQMMVGAHRLRAVVGQRSAGTNGNITGLSLPGGFTFSYTGMEVRNPDGSQHHAVGIMPDVVVPLTATDLRDGIDRDLLTAIGLLH